MIFKDDVVLLSEFAKAHGCRQENFYQRKEPIHTKIGTCNYVFKRDIENSIFRYSKKHKTSKTKELYLEAFGKCSNLKGSFNITHFLKELGVKKNNFYDFLYDVELKKIAIGKKHKLFAKPRKDGVFDKIFKLIDEGYTAMVCEKDDEYMDYIFRISGQRYIGLWK